MGQVQRRLPYEPLGELFAGRCWNDKDVEKQIGVSRYVLIRYRREGGIPMGSADRIACLLGYTPDLIWPDFGDEPYEIPTVSDEL